jgi:hypothetical protein
MKLEALAALGTADRTAATLLKPPDAPMVYGYW